MKPNMILSDWVVSSVFTVLLLCLLTDTVTAKKNECEGMFYLKKYSIFLPDRT